ncbi:nitrile hydratase subunit alpha [Actinacidiphila oryziradicis]|uniref:Nitrile hydratase subunit beta n=1 Tax=Actinacidiphila oryziradicis TaxID=2571141 RepID=A0A4U0RYI9_9ACTN|nr:nitrile hydratase subunit alpha [Actinacidiphila oryziradicis]TJZ99890.1 nitrile hydratase subunit beta [Actinacidiphila oryziradicis]
MDGPHDLGGRMDFGTVNVEMVLVSAASAPAPNQTLSSFRYAVERMDPVHYLGSPYYEHWLTATTTIAVEAGLLGQEQLEKRAGGPFPLAHPPRVRGPENPGTGAKRFAAGDRVRVWRRHPLGHTRCPGYCPLEESVDIQVWDSSAEVPYLVLPERPAGTDGVSEDALAALVTRDSMVGVEVL